MFFSRFLRYTLGDILFFNKPAEGTPHDLIDLTLAIIRSVIPFTGPMLQDCMVREKKYFSPIELGKIDPSYTEGLRIRETDKERQDHEKTLREEIDALQASLDGVRKEFQHQSERLQAELRQEQKRYIEQQAFIRLKNRIMAYRNALTG